MWEDRLSQHQYYNKKSQRSHVPALFLPFPARSKAYGNILEDRYSIVHETDATFSYAEESYTHRLIPEYAVLNLPATYSLTYI